LYLIVNDVLFWQTSTLLAERLQAWKHACGYLEDYIGATMKAQAAHSKEYEKILKVSASFPIEKHTRC
jgi:hypothetical protein